MKTFILATLVAAAAFTGTAQAGINIDATKGPIMVSIDNR